MAVDQVSPVAGAGNSLTSPQSGWHGASLLFDLWTLLADLCWLCTAACQRNPSCLAGSLALWAWPRPAMEKACHKLRLFFFVIPEVAAARGSGLEV